jgi:O-antigen ligase/Flp pilus assembly protein TadD
LTKRDAVRLSVHASNKAGSSASRSSCEAGPRMHQPHTELLRAAVVALLFLTPLLFAWRIQYGGALTYRFSSFEVPKEAFVQLLAVCASCYWLVAMLLAGAVRFRRNPILLPIAVFTSIAGVSVLYAPSRYNTTIEFAKMLTFIAFFLVSLNALVDEKQTRLALHALFFSGLAVATLSLLQLAGVLSWLFPVWPGNPQHMYSTFGNDSGVAGYLLPVLPIGIGLFLTSATRRSRWICFAGTAAIVYAMLACQTRGVWLGALVALVFLLVNLVKRTELRRVLSAHKWYLVLALVLAVVFVGVQFEFPAASTDEINTWTRITDTFEVDQVGVNLRAVFWGAALLMAADSPVFGLGLGSYEYYSQLYQGKLMAALGPMSRLQPNELETATAHNDYLQLASELGVVGVAVLVWCVLVFWRCVRERFRRPMEAGSSCIFLSCLSGLIGTAVFAATNFPFHVVTHTLVFMFLLAVVVSAAEPDGEAYKQWRLPQSRGLRTALSTLVVVLGIMFLVLVTLPHVADYYAASATLIGSAEPRSKAALEKLEKASRLEPRNGLIRGRLGRAYLQRGMLDEAKLEFGRALEDHDAARIHMDYAKACEIHGEKTEAVERYSEAVFRVPRYALARERLVYALMIAGQYDEAKRRADEAIQWVGETPGLLNALGAVAHHRGDKDGTRLLLEKSLELNPDQAEIRRFLQRLDRETAGTP